MQWLSFDGAVLVTVHITNKSIQLAPDGARDHITRFLGAKLLSEITSLSQVSLLSMQVWYVWIWLSKYDLKWCFSSNWKCSKTDSLIARQLPGEKREAALNNSATQQQNPLHWTAATYLITLLLYTLFLCIRTSSQRREKLYWTILHRSSSKILWTPLNRSSIYSYMF